MTRSCTRLDAAHDYIRHLLSEETQVRRYAEVGGQSADRRVWLDPGCGRTGAGRYSATPPDGRGRVVWPRFAGYLKFQARASAALRDGLIDGENHDLLLNRVNELFAGSTKGIYRHDEEARVSIAVVTGAGGALGRAIAQRLARDGHAVAVVDIDTDAVEATRNEVAAHGGAVRAWTLDLRDADAVSEMFDVVAIQAGGTGVLVNNAAIYPTTPFLEISRAEYDDVYAVNQRGYWLCAQAAARQMMEAGGGAIVNIASIVTHGGWGGLASYTASKGAAVSLTRALARELGPSGIRVNAVSPGAFPTAAEEIHEDRAAYNRFVLEHQALKRRGTPGELAAVVSFLAGPDSSFVTGQTIEVNGGWVMA